MNHVVVVCDLQFGSTGKGQVAGTIAQYTAPDTVVSANGPNAGHTFKWRDGDGKPYQVVHTMLPCAAVVPFVRNILLGPGSVIDPERLITEIRLGAQHLGGKNLIVHPNAAVVTQDHRDAERATLIHVGSTMKGTAEAVVQKMRRQPGYNTAAKKLRPAEYSALWDAATAAGLSLRISQDAYNAAIDSSDNMLIEGAQGHSLGMHERFYPHCTSRDVSVHQVLADCRIPRTYNIDVVGVCRTYPIRVANRYDSEGTMVGSSGPCYPDQSEITWESLGREPELTTVTKLPRRIFTFSTQQIIEACRVNTPKFLALTFCDYMDAHPAHVMEGELFPGPKIDTLIRRVQMASGVPVVMLGYGPSVEDYFGYSPHATRASSVYPMDSVLKNWL